MEIKRSSSQPSAQGPAEYFTGNVRIDPLIDAPEPGREFCPSVTFEPGARTAWHKHPLGQTLIVTAGGGWTRCWGEKRERYARATWSGVRPAKNAGTGPRRRRR